MFNERGGLQITEFDRPRRIVEEGGVGRRGRSRLVAVYDFSAEAGGTTRVELTTFSEPGNWVDRIKHTGIHRWVRRQSKKSLRRLKEQLEEPGPQAAQAGHRRRATSRSRHPRFGAHVPVEHESAPADG